MEKEKTVPEMLSGIIGCILCQDHQTGFAAFNGVFCLKRTACDLSCPSGKSQHSPYFFLITFQQGYLSPSEALPTAGPKYCI